MRYACLTAVLILMVETVGGASGTGVTDFTGRWRNVDQGTKSITTVEISTREGRQYVHLWGKCSPEDCDMGESAAIAFGTSAFQPLAQNASALLVRGNERTVILSLLNGRLQVEMYNEFPTGDRRSNYRIIELFDKSRMR
jgi:hypothetical protein